ncbi:MAG: undecaprenyl/decaprenyl-phosphate alpha-N-acetylglucosaminyl 1-phosphate transferase [Bacteroidales bacterium]|jgi:UDP-N-acetylmuramyl pentapeptide phosphotransferase/UDP-N-acetylglucosamine-1-phosphate transferase|nr:undecaprenyl/decaprenyl-phosphate alpha-N-acetylglucosaminyl 1-phosphate transferase [Bacteroidales bacterium]
MPEYLQIIYHPVFRTVSAFLVAFLVGYYSIPVIINVARSKNLVDEPNHRTSHKGKVPTLGGIAIFMGFSIAILTFNTGLDSVLSAYLIAGAVIIFFLGLKDDLLELSPLAKIYGQIIAALIVIVPGGIRLTDLHGFLGFNQIPYLWSIAITVFVFVVIVNSFNLVDGIDGLAGGLAVVASVFLGEWFFKAGQTGLVIIAISLIGVLFAFLRYNLLDSKYKIFMGDTGSLLLGFILSVMVIKFNEFNVEGHPLRSLESAPSLSFAILMIPLFDTLRLFVVRLYRKCTPFAPDRAHMHHILLKLGFSHLNATYTLLIANIAFVMVAWQFQYLGTTRLFGMLLLLGTIFTIIPFTINAIKKKQRHDLGKTMLHHGK